MKHIQMKILLFMILVFLVGCGNREYIKESSLTISETKVTSSQYTIENTTEENETAESVQSAAEDTKTEITDHTLSEEEREIQNIAKNFSTAYFNGDEEEIKKYLTDPYDWEIEVFSNPEKAADISDIAINGISDIGNKNVDDICVITVQYKNSVSDDWRESLTVELIKKSEGWKIQFYGIE